MEDSKEQKYFNFPIVLLEGFLINHIKCLNDIIRYAIYVYSIKNYNGDIEEAENFFGIKLRDKDKIIRNGKYLYECLPDGLPKVGISKDIYYDYQNNGKTEFEKVTLLAFLAIKSILQDKPYIAMNNNYLFARMDGKRQSIKNDSELSPELAKYKNEYQAKKIKNELILGWGLKHYAGHTRGFYVSFKMPLVELIFQVEKNKKSNKLKEQKEKEEAAKIEALNRLSKK